MSQLKTHQKQSLSSAIATLFKGGLIGIANIIPGVSGGTFALILGVFDRIIDALNRLHVQSLITLIRFIFSGFRGKAKQDFQAEWKRLDMNFIILLGLGAVATILSSSFLIDYLLKERYSPTLAFFIGLILPSIAIPWAMMERRGMALFWILPGIALTLWVSFIIPEGVAGSDNLLLALLTGAISISAMILPGLSGSYIMLIMGQYQNVLDKLTGLQRSLGTGSIDMAAVLWLGTLAAGMAIGIVLFARLLHFLLARFRSATMAFLIGLLLGSLWVLWPFKDIQEGAEIVDRHGIVKQEVQIATAPNCLPSQAHEILLPGAALGAGLLSSGGLVLIGKRSKTEAESDKVTENDQTTI